MMTRPLIPVLLSILSLAALVPSRAAAKKSSPPPPERPVAEVTYSGPKNRHAPSLAGFQPPYHQEGATLFVAVPDSNLRRAPKADAEVTAVLPLGTAVVVKAIASESVRVGERVDQWLEVDVTDRKGAKGKVTQHGFVFGGALTTAAYVLDFDDDGKDEIVTVAWTPDYKIRVRVLDDEGPAGVVAHLDLEPGGQAYACCGGNIKVEVVPKAEAGLTLLRLESSPEACSDFSVAYVSDVGGVLRTALSSGGLRDPPSYAEPTVRFDAKAKTAEVTIVAYAEEEEGKRTDEERSVRRHRLKDGVYVAEDASGPGPSGSPAGRR
jgi:hypothetical protein